MAAEHKPKKPADSPAAGEEGDDAVIGRAFFWSLAAIIPLAVIGIVVWLVVTWPNETAGTDDEDDVDATLRAVNRDLIPRVLFKDITREAGIDFVHENGAYGDKLLPETMGGGAAFFDYDNDGDQDLLLVNSCQWPCKVPLEEQTATMALYQNDGKGRFTDVTAECGLDVTFYGMGAAVGDYDNNGWRDLFISGVRDNRLFRNVEGKFVDVTDRAGVGGSGKQWSTSCGWLDYNNDGLLDLFVCNYVAWSEQIDLQFVSTLDGTSRAYKPPDLFDGAFPYLYRNEGDGKFTEVSAEAGLRINKHGSDVPLAKGLGVIFFDLNEDGWTDIVMANDTVANQAFQNLGNGRFSENANLIGVDVGASGEETGAMGMDVARIRRTGSIAIAVGNFANEPASFYVDSGGGTSFSDEGTITGLGPQTEQALTFGVFFFDYDLDGRLDVLTANGHLENDIAKVQPGQTYAQAPHLFWNVGQDEDTEFVPVIEQEVGPDLLKPMVGRGAAYADIDGDGDLDILITAVGGPPRLLRNDQKLAQHWLRFKLIGHKCNRDAIGAWIEVHLGDRVLRRRVAPTRSYLSQVELPVTFGLRKSDEVGKVTIFWPDGNRQQLDNVQIDCLNVIEQAP